MDPPVCILRGRGGKFPGDRGCCDWGRCGRGNGTLSCAADGGRHSFPHRSSRVPTGPCPAPVLRSFLSRPSLCCSLPLCVCMRAKSLQSCPTLCDRTDCSPPGSSVPGIFQTRILEWVAMPSSGDLPDQGIKLSFLTSPALASGFFTTRPT